MHDVLPGISAVLVVDRDPVDVSNVVLDLAAVLDGLVADNFEIILCDLGPAGRAKELEEEMAVRRPHLPVRALDSGFARRNDALATGFSAAAYDLVFVTSSDGRFDVSELNHLLEAIEQGADVAVGYRSPELDRLGRRLRSWAWNALLRVRFGTPVRDVNCEFKLLRKTVWERAKPRSLGRTFNAELLARVRRAGFVITEVPTRRPHPRFARPLPEGEVVTTRGGKQAVAFTSGPSGRGLG